MRIPPWRSVTPLPYSIPPWRIPLLSPCSIPARPLLSRLLTSTSTSRAPSPYTPRPLRDDDGSIVPRGTHWFKFWRLLHKEETQQQIIVVCQSLKVMAMEFFASHGWRFHARIEAA
uniref:Uncharacterized protein n=1 Tax=Zea mays TaxID=4577 RepID=A0A804R6I1_MAIZE